jgi:hypothetical protein
LRRSHLLLQGKELLEVQRHEHAGVRREADAVGALLDGVPAAAGGAPAGLHQDGLRRRPSGGHLDLVAVSALDEFLKNALALTPKCDNPLFCNDFHVLSRILYIRSIFSLCCKVMSPFVTPAPFLFLELLM